MGLGCVKLDEATSAAAASAKCPHLWVACVSLSTAPHSSRAIASESHGVQVEARQTMRLDGSDGTSQSTCTAPRAGLALPREVGRDALVVACVPLSASRTEWRPIVGCVASRAEEGGAEPRSERSKKRTEGRAQRIARERGPCVDGAENEADEEEPLERARPSVPTALEPVGAATMDLRCCSRHVEA